MVMNYQMMNYVMVVKQVSLESFAMGEEKATALLMREMTQGMGHHFLFCVILVENRMLVLVCETYVFLHVVGTRTPLCIPWEHVVKARILLYSP